MKLWNWIKKLFKKKTTQTFQLEIPKIEVTLEAKSKKEALNESRKAIDVLLKKQEYWREREEHTSHTPKAGVEATRQDVSKFMKHGHQAPWYRKTVKAKIQPDEEED